MGSNSCRTLRLLCNCFAIVVVSTGGSFGAAERVGRPSEESESADQAEQIAILELLSSQMQGNFEKIHTWSGRFEVKDWERLKEEAQETLLGKIWQSPVSRSCAGGGEFFVDVDAELLYSTFEVNPTTVQFTEIVSGIGVPTRQLKEQHEEFIVTPQKTLRFKPDETYRNLRDYKQITSKDPKPKRAAFREERQYRIGDEIWGYIIDPRAYFNHGNRPFWNEFMLYIGALRDEKYRDKMRDLLEVQRMGSQDMTGYAVAFRLAKSGIVQTLFLDSQVGFNPTRWEQRGKSGLLEREIVWKWKLQSGIYVFDVVTLTLWSADGEARFKRELRFVDLVLNEPIPPEKFTEKQFGLEEGDRLVDRVDRRVYALDQGQLIPETADGLVRPHSSVWSIWLMSLSVVALAAGCVALRRHYRSRVRTQ